jgi:serine/threonine protein phosphatase PrpC
MRASPPPEEVPVEPPVDPLLDGLLRVGRSPDIEGETVASDNEPVQDDRQPVDVGPDNSGPELAEPLVVERDAAAHRPFGPENSIGDAGRQAEVLAAAGPMTVGVADTELDFATVVPFEVRACTTRGLSHRHRGTPRQDAFSVAVSEDSVVVAVADGVSEGPWSHVAAETAARAACKLVVEYSGRENESIDWTQLSRRVSLRILEEAEYRQIIDPPEEGASIDERITRCRSAMSCTLVVATARRQADHEGRFPVVLAVLAGDSGVYLINREGLSLAIGGKSDGDSLITSSAVRPLPGAVEPALVELSLGEDEGLIVVTDGLTDPIGDGTGEVGRELAERWRTPPTIDRFLLDVNFLRRSFDDDRTAVGVWLLPELA